MLAFLLANGASLGPLLSGLSLLVASLAAWATYVFVSRRTIKTQWFETFGQLYDEFWKNPDIAKARQWVVSDLSYLEIEPILQKRLASIPNLLELHENEKLEIIDRFCALVTRIQFFDRTFAHRGMDRERRELLVVMDGKFWAQRTARRAALRGYIRRFWPGIRLGPYRTSPRVINVLRRFRSGRKIARRYVRLSRWRSRLWAYIRRRLEKI